MSQETNYTETQAHKYFATKLNNRVWALLAKPTRDPHEDLMMIHEAHASCYHWYEVGTAVNASRGEWLISRVYAVLNQPEPALYHARKTLSICQQNTVEDFDTAYAYEAMARALAAAGEQTEAKNYLVMAQEAGNNIQDEEDRKIFNGDLEAEPWCNLKSV